MVSLISVTPEGSIKEVFVCNFCGNEFKTNTEEVKHRNKCKRRNMYINYSH